MFWKVLRTEFEQQKGEANRRAQKAIVDSGKIPGILAYSNGEPVGWCAVEPRVNYSLLERSRILKPVDDQPVWSVTCFYVEKAYRHKGLTVELLHAAA